MPRIRGEAVGQNEDRCSRLRGLIDRYPSDSGILKELIQNADDGQARRVRIILDCAVRNPEGLPEDKLMEASGPAIIAWNDKPFNQQDFENLEKLANSSKIEDSFKTGRFGLGFNAVYNVTDFPLLLTASKLWCLDPCETLLSNREGGERWELEQLIQEDVAGILELFDPVGYRRDSALFPSTAFRLPLRTASHVRINQDCKRPGEAMISSKVFTENDFTKIVEGLGEIAHELLLFLKNIEFVSCSYIDEQGAELNLLEIKITNKEEVSMGREAINGILREGLDASLEACAGSGDRPPESCYPVEIEVKRKGGKPEQSRWMVVTGLYPGKDDILINASRKLHQVGERGLPHSGVAVCLSRSGEDFPEVEGRLFCYLPIAGREYAGNFPIHVHGAFSLDDSRTTLTGHREDAHGKAAALADWNELLLMHATPRAYARALEEIPLIEQVSVNPQWLAERLYRLFPLLQAGSGSHSALLAESALKMLSKSEVFYSARGEWTTLNQLLSIPPDRALRDCLEQEGLHIAMPALPSKLTEDLESAGVSVPSLSAKHLVEHFRREESGAWKIEEAPFIGLRSRSTIIAVTRFISEERHSDWSLLPLAICKDGWVRTFPDEGQRPLFIGTKRQKEIYGRFPEWFLDSEFCEGCQLKHSSGKGLAVMSVVRVLELLNEILVHPETGESCWNPNGGRSPNTAWLITLYEELLSDSGLGESGDLHTLLKRSSIVPADDGNLHTPGSAVSPLLIANTETSLSPLLQTLGVRYFILNPQDPLTKSKVFTRFKLRTGLLWSLSPGGLIDSLGVKLDQLLATVGEWRSDKTRARLVKFLSGIHNDNLSGDRIETLKMLPIWKDVSGAYGPIGANDYLQGEFEPPAIPRMVKILAEGKQTGLLELLGLKMIGRHELLVEHLLPRLADFDEVEFLEVTCWIRDQWNFLCAECTAGEEELVRLLETKKLLQDQQGKRARASDLYIAETVDLAAHVLGGKVRTPSSEWYSIESGLWGTFFEKLGILETPSPQHLVAFVESIAEQCKERVPTSTEEESLIRVLRHVRDQFDNLADVEVKSDVHGVVDFAVFLAETAWIPAYRQIEGNVRFVAWRDPEQRLFEPRELIHFNLGARCASTRPLSPRGVREFSENARDRLGIDRYPSAHDICGHLSNVIKGLGTVELSEEDCGKIGKELEDVYRGLGEVEREAEKANDEHSVKILVEECSRLNDSPCLFDPRYLRLRLPRDVYKTGAALMAPLKVEITGGSKDIENGMILLGRLPEPGVEDIAATLKELSFREESLNEVELSAVVACTERFTSLIRENRNSEPPKVALPNKELQMRDSAELLVIDDPVLSAVLSIPKNRAIHHFVSPGIASVIRIASLTSAQAKPSGELHPCCDVQIVERCETLEDLLRSKEFVEGLERLLRQEGRTIYDPALKWLSVVTVKACETVTCDYSLKLVNGKILHLGTAESEVAFAAVGEGGEFLVSRRSSDAELLETHFLRELLRQLDEQAPGRDRELLAMLKGSASDIHHTLDRLHISRVETIEFLEDQQGPVVLGGEESEDETDPDQDGERDLGSVNGLGSQSGDTLLPEVNDGLDGTAGKAGGQASARGGTSQGGNRRGGQSGTHGTSGVGRRRMLKGDEDTREEAKRIRRTARQQDGYWISRPKTEEQARKQREEGDYHSDEDEDGRNLEIGDMAVGWVLQYEYSQGRKAMSMAHANPGYDVESRKRRTVERYIEVKGIDGEWGRNGVSLSDIQFFRARESEDFERGIVPPMGDKFWLYVVEHARDPQKVRIHMIRNPAAKANEFRIDCGWRDAGSEVQDFTCLMPERGMTLRKFSDEGGYEDGLITRVDDNNYLMVQFGSGAATTVVYNPTRHLLIQLLENS